jgi:hypothetical protein
MRNSRSRARKVTVRRILVNANIEESNTLCRIIAALHYFLLKDKTELSPAQKANYNQLVDEKQSFHQLTSKS